VKAYIDALAGTTLDAQRVEGSGGGVEERKKDGGEEGRRRVEAKREGRGWRRGRGGRLCVMHWMRPHECKRTTAHRKLNYDVSGILFHLKLHGNNWKF